MKKILVIAICVGACSVSQGQIPVVTVLTTLAKKVINALDLEVQRIQNSTIWLQNVQKELENEMSALKLDEISQWVQKQRDLYSEYYDELWKVKEIISDYDKIKRIVQMQGNIVSEYKNAFALFQKDQHFSKDELDYMLQVYTGILDESLKTAEQLLMVTNDFITQMDDADRLSIIDRSFTAMQKIYNDLKQFNSQNIQLSLQRAAQDNDVESVKKLYGLDK